MKTKNILAIAFIHFINNNIGYLLYGATGENVTLIWQAVIINLFIFSIVYMPFLLSKEYRKSKTIEERVLTDE